MKFFSAFLISTIFFGCTGSKYSADDYINYSNSASYSPSAESKIVGCYYSNNGFGGTVIQLNKDGTYFFNSWTDIYDPRNPIVGYEGKFKIAEDSLLLNFSQYKIDQTKDSTLISQARQEEKELQLSKRPDIWLFKRMGNNIFLVSARTNILFGQFSLENRGVPEVNNRKQKKYGKFFPLKTSNSVCNNTK